MCQLIRQPWTISWRNHSKGGNIRGQQRHAHVRLAQEYVHDQSGGFSPGRSDLQVRRDRYEYHLPPSAYKKKLTPVFQRDTADDTPVISIRDFNSVVCRQTRRRRDLDCIRFKIHGFRGRECIVESVLDIAYD